MSEEEAEAIVTEDGQESALRSAQLLRPTDPDLADCLAQYASRFDELIADRQEKYAIITADGVFDIFFDTEKEGLRFASNTTNGERAIVHKVSRFGIPSTSTYVSGFEQDDSMEIFEDLRSGKIKPNITGTTNMPIIFAMILEQKLGEKSPNPESLPPPTGTGPLN